ncbi:MAG: dihydrodipicolinate reductase [Pseudomonadota bacterium]
MSSRIKLAVAGASGKMGQLLVAQALQDPQVELVVALDRPDGPLQGQDAGLPQGLKTGVLVSHGLADLAGADVLIDFTRPEASLEHLKACQLHGVGLVLGTTGFDAAGLAAVAAFGQEQRLVFAPNMSVGVNITLKLLELAGRHLSSGFDIEVIEAHHRQKVDAPSGTALKMGQVVAQAAGRRFDQDAVYSRVGHTGARTDAEIGFSVIRGGDIVGDHTVLFAGQGERIEITHKSSSRATYAQGAVRAAKFLMTQPVGQYDMFDVLGLAAV